MTTYEHILEGCAPVPLAGYLKALGVLRLIAEQRDKGARGFWRNERFVLQTRLTVDELVRFFAEEYEPSSIISPWNGRAGFLEGEDEESDEKSSRQGAVLVRCYTNAGDRFKKLRDAVKVYSGIEVIKKLDKARAEAKPLEEKRLKKATLSENEKVHLKELQAYIKRCRASVIADLRSEAPDWAIGWFDACQRITQERIVSPLLGSGGLDGSRDFGVNFGSALESLFDLKTGVPLENTTALVRASLGFDISASLGAGNLGQYEPGSGGENTTTGFVGEQPSNPLDFILLLEGAVLFSGATTRRLEGNETRPSFPFTVGALTAGSGATSSTDDQNFTEFWAPLWLRPAKLEELSVFLTEGRTVIGGSSPKDGLEFAVAVSTLGSQRGIREYERFALLQREPRNPKKATPLGRVRVRENPKATLISELDARGWLTRARAAGREKNAPASLSATFRKLDDALFHLAADSSPSTVQDALIAFGNLMLEVARRPKPREGLPPPPPLSLEWTINADDGSHEFALAAAAASLDANSEDFRLPFRRHLAPLDWPKGRESWSDDSHAHALAVWTGRDLIRDMNTVLVRRLIEAQRHVFSFQENAELPLRGWRPAPLASVAAFLAERTNDNRIAALAAGLAWARSGNPLSPITEQRQDALPFAYAALKSVFVPNGVGPPEMELKKRVDPLPLIRLVHAGRAAEALIRAQAMARGAGLPSPFGRCLFSALTLDANRLTASLLFPVAPSANKRLIERAYPDLKKEREEEVHAD